MPNDASIKMLRTALDMEEKGRSFYEKALAQCKNNLGREIFSTLIEDEGIHIERIKTIYGNLTGGKPWNDDWQKLGEGHMDLKPFFRSLAEKRGCEIKAQTSDIDALKVGMDFEQKSVDFYQAELKRVTDKVEKLFLEKMVLEEKSHFAVLSDMRFYLEDPAAWYSEKERTGYDGA